MSATACLRIWPASAFGRLNGRKSLIEHQVIDNFQSPGNVERKIDKRGICKHKACEKRRESSTDRSCHARQASGRRSFFWANNSHYVRLSGWHVHLADAERSSRTEIA